MLESTTTRDPLALHDAAKLARDLRRDLGHLRRRGVDPATFLGGALVRIVRRVETDGRA
jgi:hypothetical protein